MATKEIRNTESFLDSRDIIARIDWLTTLDELDDDETTELAALSSLAEEGADYCPDWEYGETLIHDSYFTEYAQELAEDIGAISSDAAWPLSYIDWERAADALKVDYSALDFAGQTYWAR